MFSRPVPVFFPFEKHTQFCGEKQAFVTMFAVLPSKVCQGKMHEKKYKQKRMETKSIFRGNAMLPISEKGQKVAAMQTMRFLWRAQFVANLYGNSGKIFRRITDVLLHRDLQSLLGV